MSCNSVAVANSQLTVSLADLLSTDAGQAAVKQILAQLLQAGTVRIERTDYWNATSIRAGRWQIWLADDGELTVSCEYGDRAAVAAMTEKIKAALTALAQLAAQEKVRAAIANKYRITGQQRTANGALVLSFDV